MAIRKTEAIVLKTMPFRTSSLIVTLFSRDYGKIRGLAKGVRLERETRGALYELFTRLEVVYYEKTRSDLHLLSEAFLDESYEPMRAQLESITYAAYFAELVDETTEIQDAHPQLFELLDFSFRYLSSIPGERVARLFEIKLLREIGWLPYLDNCVNCSRSGLESGFFSARQGALVCPSCVNGFPDARPLEREALAVMRYYSGHELEDCLRHGISSQAEAELKTFMGRFFAERLSRPLKSRQFIEKIKPVMAK